MNMTVERFFAKLSSGTVVPAEQQPTVTKQRSGVSYRPEKDPHAADEQDLTKAAFPMKSLETAFAALEKVDASGLHVKLTLVKNHDDFEVTHNQDRIEKLIVIESGQRLMLCSKGEGGKKVSSFLVTDADRVGIEHYFHAVSTPLFVSHAAGVEIENAQTAAVEGKVEGYFWKPLTRDVIRLNAGDLADWTKDGSDLTRTVDGCEMRLTNVAPSDDGNGVNSSILKFTAPLQPKGKGPTSIDLGRFNGSDYRVQVVGANVIGVSETRWAK